MTIFTVKTTGVTFFENDTDGKCITTDEEANAALDSLSDKGRYFFNSCMYQAIWFCFYYCYNMKLPLSALFSSVMHFTSKTNCGINDLFFDTDDENSLKKLGELAGGGGFRIEMYTLIGENLILGRKIGNDDAKIVVKVLAHGHHIELIKSMYDNFDMDNFTKDGFSLNQYGTDQNDDDEEIAKKLQEQEEKDLEATMELIRQLTC